MNNCTRNEGMWDEIDQNRDFLKCPDFSIVMAGSDQEKELTQPPLCKSATGEIIEISADFDDAIKCDSYTGLLDIRRSERVYDKDTPMTQNQLAFLLWSIQGVQSIKGANYATLRPVPSGGARHPFETYFLARNVDGLKPGIYHYLPLEHVGEKRVAIELVKEFTEDVDCVSDMLEGQKWASDAPVIVFLSCVAYRAEWRYTVFAHRVVLIDLGHAGQNLMLSAAAMGLGSCCMAAYNQKLCDDAIGLDGYEEYTVYACSVGKVK
ncbi:MAG: SagB/ThcOx family dehydrogenase [Oscillospiraceae bacterium]|jgi:SagB-type dehydrogenase family enzyme|nr:SagB/ThcOx family dehydrogenase [Oscillospiraceae bacterium]